MNVGQRGQVTIPRNIRLKYGLKPRTKVEFVEERGMIILRPIHTHDSQTKLNRWKGFLKNKPEDVDAFIEDIRGR